jgi:hypothetical protein
LGEQSKLKFTEAEYKRLISKTELEKELHKTVADLLGAMGLIAIHLPNYTERKCECGRKISVVIGGNDGVSDWLIIGQKGLFVIELKSKTGRLSPEQKLFLEKLPKKVPRLVSSDFEEVRKFINKNK